jgi:beta-lactamase superfamily II metal-dependent hydrolase
MKIFLKTEEKKNCLRRTHDSLLGLLIICALIIGVLSSCTGTSNQNELTLAFLDAGQGDSTLIMTKSGKNVLIDTGAPDSTDKIISALNKYGAYTLDLLILTHMHEDHVAGTLRVLEEFEVKKLWCLKTEDNYITNAIKSRADSLNCDTVYATEGDCTVIDEKTEIGIRVLSAYAENDLDNANENALVVSLYYGDFRALFMADAGFETEEYLMENCPDDIKCDVLRVGHHGSSTASSKEFVKATGAQVAVISCAENNAYGHPHASTLEVLDNCCEDILFTYGGGAEIYVNGDEISYRRKSKDAD